MAIKSFSHSLSRITLSLFLTSCVAGGGGTTFNVTKYIMPGDNINISMEIYEYGNNNVHKSVMPISFCYKINDGLFIAVQAINNAKTTKDRSLYTFVLSTNGMNLTTGDIIETKFNYTWHGQQENRTGTTLVQSIRQGD